jgi:hypothetical protein
MITVHKYPLTMGTDIQTVELPFNAEILHIAYQHGLLQLWAKININEYTEKRTILMVGTGMEISDYHNPNDHYINTIFIENGTFVFHFFERMKS